MEIAISSELGMNVNVFELHVDSLMPSLLSLTSSIAIAGTAGVPHCARGLTQARQEAGEVQAASATCSGIVSKGGNRG